MSKSVNILLTLALVLAVWINLSPEAHQRTIQLWNDIRPTLVKITVDVTEKLLEALDRLKINNQPVTTPPSSDPVTSIGQQIAAGLKALGEALERAWAATMQTLHLKP